MPGAPAINPTASATTAGPASSKEQPNKLQLKYFPIRGKAEAIRLLLEDQGIKYEDLQVGPEWSLVEKQEGYLSGKYPFQQLPCLTLADRTTHITQADAILRYLARLKGIYGTNEMETVRCDVICSACEEWRTAYTRLVYHPDFETLKMQYLADTVPTWFRHFDNLLQRNINKNFLVGESITFVDYIVLELLNVHLNLHPQCLEKFPLLATYRQRLANRPYIQRYWATGRRPERVNGKGAWWDCWSVAEREALKLERQAPWF